MIYKLRWYFDYFTRPAYYGCWSYADPKRPAWCHNYEGLARAIIHGKDGYGNIKVLADCSGQDFMNFSWMAQASFNPLKSFTNKKLSTKIVGLMMQTRNGQIKVYIDGTVERDNKVYDINFATYGK